MLLEAPKMPDVQFTMQTSTVSSYFVFVGVFFRLSAPAFLDHHALVFIIQNHHAVLILVQHGNGLELSGHAAGLRGSLRTLQIEQRLDYRVFGGRHFTSQRKITCAAAGERLITRRSQDERVPADVLKIHVHLGFPAVRCFSAAPDSRAVVVDQVRACLG